jgi:hypothetical protein
MFSIVCVIQMKNSARVCDEKNREVGLMLKEYSDVVQCEEK